MAHYRKPIVTDGLCGTPLGTLQTMTQAMIRQLEIAKIKTTPQLMGKFLLYNTKVLDPNSVAFIEYSAIFGIRGEIGAFLRSFCAARLIGIAYDDKFNALKMMDKYSIPQLLGAFLIMESDKTTFVKWFSQVETDDTTYDRVYDRINEIAEIHIMRAADSDTDSVAETLKYATSLSLELKEVNTKLQKFIKGIKQLEMKKNFKS